MADPPIEPTEDEDAEPGLLSPYGFGGGDGQPRYGLPAPRRPAEED